MYPKGPYQLGNAPVPEGGHAKRRPWDLGLMIERLGESVLSGRDILQTSKRRGMGKTATVVLAEGRERLGKPLSQLLTGQPWYTLLKSPLQSLESLRLEVLSTNSKSQERYTKP